MLDKCPKCGESNFYEKPGGFVGMDGKPIYSHTVNADEIGGVEFYCIFCEDCSLVGYAKPNPEREMIVVFNAKAN